MPMLEKYFSTIPAGPKPLPMTTNEPKQFAEKSVVIKENTQPFYLEGYHRPDYRDPDDAVYDAITDIVSNGRTARLYRSLVRDQRIAAEAEGFSGFPGQKFPGLFAFYAVPLRGHTPEEMKVSIEKELDRLKTEDVTDEELARYKTCLNQKRTCCEASPITKDWHTNSPKWLRRGFSDWRELFNQLQRVDAVTKADIKRVANKTFVASNRTTARIETADAQPKAANSAGVCGMNLLSKQFNPAQQSDYFSAPS